jgi:hypothetical protein
MDSKETNQMNKYETSILMLGMAFVVVSVGTASPFASTFIGVCLLLQALWTLFR